MFYKHSFGQNSNVLKDSICCTLYSNHVPNKLSNVVRTYSYFFQLFFVKYLWMCIAFAFVITFRMWTNFQDKVTSVCYDVWPIKLPPIKILYGFDVLGFVVRSFITDVELSVNLKWLLLDFKFVLQLVQLILLSHLFHCYSAPVERKLSYVSSYKCSAYTRSFFLLDLGQCITGSLRFWVQVFCVATILISYQLYTGHLIWHQSWSKPIWQQPAQRFCLRPGRSTCAV